MNMKDADFSALNASTFEKLTSAEPAFEPREGNIPPFSDILEQAKAHFSSSKGSHGWDHTIRVHRLCLTIGRKEGADLHVLSIASLLHDIGRCYQDNSKGAVCHARKGVEMAKSLVEPLSLTNDQKKNILHCIASHRFRKNNPPKTLEAKILFDADKIDAIGAVGIARAFLFAGEVGARLHAPELSIEETEPYSVNDTGYREYVVKLSKIKDRILTEEGKKIAFQRHEFMKRFFAQFIYEIEERDNAK
ncbi:MAG: HD domain-containing protein [Desulfobacterales bacterium]